MQCLKKLKCIWKIKERKKLSLVKMVTCGHFPLMPGERGGDATGNMEHAINAIHCKKRDEKPQFFYDEKNDKIPVRSPLQPRLRLRLVFPPRLPLFQRFWRRFLPCFWCNKGTPTDQMIEQRPQASSQNFQAKRGASLTNLNRGASQKPN